MEAANSVHNVRFYKREVDLPFESQKQGRPVKEMRDFVRIEIAGNQTLVIDDMANKSHMDQFPLEWARYQNQQRDSGAQNVSGTMLSDWPILTSAQANELKHYHFYSVEQVANASDAQLSQIGMVVGMAPHQFRDKAKSYLARAKDAAIVDHQADELRKRDQEIQALKEQLGELLTAIKPEKKSRKREEAQEVAHE